MNQIFDKLGIYDLVAVLLSGICITSFSLVVDQIFFQSQLSKFLAVEDTILFVVISYFIGLIFQEVGSLLQKQVVYKNNKLLLKALDTSKYSHESLTQEEKDGIYQAVQKELGLETVPKEDILYNYCKFYLIANGNMVKADKEQSILGLSRSLSLYFFVLFWIVCSSAIKTQNLMHYFCTIGIFMLSVLLYYRYIRFAKMRYVYIFRSFYYRFLQDKVKEYTKESSKNRDISCKRVTIKCQRQKENNRKHRKYKSRERNRRLKFRRTGTGILYPSV